MKKLENSNYFKVGITAFCVVAASIILYFAIARMDAILNALNVITGIVTPFIMGLVLAYLLCPLYNLVRDVTLNIQWAYLSKKVDSKKKEPAPLLSKVTATVVSLCAFMAVIIGLLWVLLPQLFESVVALITQLPSGIDTLLHWVREVMADQPDVAAVIDSLLQTISANLTTWLEETVIGNYNVLLNNISSGIIGVFSMFVNIFVGIIICVFFLNTKSIFAAQTKKLLFALFSKEKADDILRGSVFVNKTFGGFINGKLLDSLIIGVICFIVMTIFDWPFAPLISVIIGVTNIIPFFGPFIGAIPSTLLILIVDPMTGLYFVIFILILQQVDGNIIGPKILGNSTGISSFWVLFAILVGGGIFGFLGMIVGIPIFAVIYAYTCYNINKRLKKKGLSTDLRDYKYIYTERIEVGEEKPSIKEEKDKEEIKKEILDRTPIDKGAEIDENNLEGKSSKKKKDAKEQLEKRNITDIFKKSNK